MGDNGRLLFGGVRGNTWLADVDTGGYRKPGVGDLDFDRIRFPYLSSGDISSGAGGSCEPSPVDGNWGVVARGQFVGGDFGGDFGVRQALDP